MPKSEQPFVKLALPLWEHLVRTRWPVRKSYVKFHKAERREGDPYRSFAALRAGHPVTPAEGQAFVDYLIKIGLVQSADCLLEPSAPPVRDAGWWKNWHKIVDRLLGPIEITEDAFVHDPGRELPAVALAIAETVGRFHAHLMPGGTNLDRGERVMGRPVAATTDWLRMAYDHDPHTVLYATVKGRRVSAAVLVATTEACREAFCRGDRSDQEIGRADLVRSGKHVFVFGMAPLGDQSGVTVSQRERAEIRTTLYQAAYLTRGVDLPWFYTFAGSPLYQDRLKNQGYVETGTNMKGTDKPVMTLCPPGAPGSPRASLKRRRDYATMLFAFGGLTRANQHLWAEADADRAKLGL